MEIDWRKEFDTSAAHYLRAKEKAYTVLDKTGWISTTEIDSLIAEEVLNSFGIKYAEYEYWKKVSEQCKYHTRDLNAILND